MKALYIALLAFAAVPASGKDLELGQIETEQSRAAAARHEQKLDPGGDGWDSEAFAEKAEKQLKQLASLLANPGKLTAGDLGKIVDLRQVVIHSPYPVKQLQEVFRSEETVVWRLPEGISLAGQRDVPLNFKKLADAFQSPRLKFKLFNVSLLTEDLAETRQFVAISDSHREHNATWKIIWSLENVKILKLELEQFEEVVRPGSRPLFRDATGSVLGDDPALSNHLGHGINYWQGRIEKILSMHYFGHNGMAVGDVNGDGLDDLYVCQAAAVPNKLLLQQKDGTVVDAAASSGTDLANASRGALLVDLDNDGDQDLAITTPYATLVYANDGKGRFSLAQNVSFASGGYSLTSADYDNDGDLDLYVCVYYRKPGDARALAYPIPYHDANNGGQNLLLRNEGRLKFSDATKSTGMLAENHRFSFAASWEDMDGDGDQDVYVANDYGRNNLYRNLLSETGKASFISDAATAGIEDTSFGMSVCWGDADGDGKIDLYTGNMFSGAGNRIAFQNRFQQHAPGEIKAKLQQTARGNSMFINNGDKTFRDATLTSGARQGRWAWGSIFADVNNDGLEDLVVGNGFVTGKREDDL